MRLLITTDTVGGVWRFGIELAEGLLRAGDTVVLVSFGGIPSASQRLECKRLAECWTKQFYYSASATPLEWMQQNERSYDEGLLILKQMARTFAIDLLHSNQYCYGASDFGVPTVVSAHSDVLSWAEACCEGVIENSPWLQRYSALVQRGLEGAAALTAPTEWMLQNFSSHFDVPKHRQVIANGRTLDLVPSCPRSLQAVTAGRLWDKAKDISLLRSIKTKIPLTIAGAANCDGMASDPIPNARYCGELSQEELLRLFAECAIYICTSRYEPFGLAPIEAALCGCAVLARDIKSLREVWGNAALFFRNADELSNILESLSIHPASLRAQQHRAKAHAQRYSRERMAEEYRALYTAVLAKEYACAG
jgi:glycosyltransferase involved in cell wall biosynthesis